MRVLFLGDVVGRSARNAVYEALPRLRQRLSLDFIIINVENAAGGFGVTRTIANEFLDAGADCLTTGNHVWDQRDILSYIDEEPRLLRPANFPPGTPGRGSGLFDLDDGRRVFVANIMARLFMDPLDDPFAAADRLFDGLELGRDVDCAVVDFHGEATSEKQSMGYYLDGRASMVVGTHTHVPTADVRILPEGTAYQSDAGMCGVYESVLGMKKDPAIERFVKKVPGERLSAAEGAASLCGMIIETDAKTGLATKASAFQQGGCLAPIWPSEFAEIGG
ncbi:MAG: TIGR00282 family metallophosphoesterase [Pseudomonadota bacterium]